MFLRVTGSEHDIHDIFLDLLVQINFFHDLTGTQNILRLQNGIGYRERLFQILPNDQFLFVFLRVVDHHFQHETVNLSFRQRISTLLLYRVLCCHYQERLIQFISHIAYRHLTLLHRFQQSGLHFCRGTVNLIRQNKVSENRTFLHHELLFLLGVNHRTHHVGRQQVRGKLDSTEFSVNNIGKGINRQGFRQPRNTFQQNMPVRKHTDHKSLHKMFLSYNHLVHLHRNHIDKRTLLLYALVQCFDINRIHIIDFYI